MKKFLQVWLGQLVSTLGSGLTAFSLSVWVFQGTGSTSLFALVSLAVVLPGLLLSPSAGVAADRYDRRLIMLACDAVGLLSSLVASWLVYTGRAQVWNVCLVVVATSAATTFHSPAWMASISQLVPKERLGQANGLGQMASALAQLAAPLIAGFLVVTIGLQGVLLMDVGSFAFAILTLALVRFPALPADENKPGQGSTMTDILEGWNYVRERAGLVGLVIFIFAVNFVTGMAQVSITPMVLSASTAKVLGTIMSVGGTGMLVGSVLLGVWSGPKRKIDGVLGFTALCGLGLAGFAFVPVGPLIAAPCFVMLLCVPFILGMYQVIWQRKVPARLQGRVFALLGMVGRLAAPLTFVLVGPLTDRVLEPLMASNGALASSVGAVIGVGKGRGSALLLLVLGALLILAALISYLAPRIRQVEAELPDAVADTPDVVPAP